VTPLLVRHDPGCRYAREDNGGHSDAAKRISDWYNLHKTAGGRIGQVFAVTLAAGSSNGDLYDTRAEAVLHAQHHEHWLAFIKLGPASMSVCQAASVLYMERMAAHLRLADRDDPRGGRVLIPRLNNEDAARQIAALTGAVDLPVAIGYAKES
jgi:hypothetical protein